MISVLLLVTIVHAFTSFVLSFILALCITFAVTISSQRMSLEFQADYNKLLKLFSTR